MPSIVVNARYNSRWVGVSDEGTRPASRSPSRDTTEMPSTRSSSYGTPLGLIATTPASRSISLTFPNVESARAPSAAFAARTRSWRLRVDIVGHEVDRMPGAGLEDDLQRRLGVEVVELDRLADAAAHQHGGADVCELPLQLARLVEVVQHDGDVVQSLAALVEPFLVDARPLERLQQLEAHVADMRFRSEHRVLGRPSAHLGAVQPRRLVPVDVPRPPTEQLRVLLHRLLQVVADDGDLRDLQLAAEESNRRLGAVLRVHRSPLRRLRSDSRETRFTREAERQADDHELVSALLLAGDDELLELQA